MRNLKTEGLACRWPVRVAIWVFLGPVLFALWVTVLRQVSQDWQYVQRAEVARAQTRAINLEQYVERTLLRPPL